MNGETGDRRWIDKRRWIVPLLAGLAWAALVLRPHGDTFTALDHSGYRLMAHAFAEGRGFHETDRVLEEAPPEVRRALMLLPHMRERNTRDRSFLTASLDEPRTEPFFYPLLPLLAAGLERALPGRGLDLAVPLFGLLFFAAWLAVGLRAGGAWGAGAATALALGSPLPLWLFRGFYVEAAGAACLAAAVALWYDECTSTPTRCVAGLLAGLAVSFHPVFIVVAAPLAALAALEPRAGLRGSAEILISFAAGMSPLWAMTAWICTPYGDLSLSTMLSNFRVSASHRLPLLFGTASGAAFLLALIARPFWRTGLPRWGGHRGVRLLILAAAAIPMAYAATRWRYAGLVRAGLHEAWTGLRWPLGILLALGVAGSLWSPRRGKPFALLVVFAVTLPVFVYLKGAEQMGMWSQRRLLPAYTLLALAVLPSLSGMAPAPRDASAARRRLLHAGFAGFLALAGLANIVRWPAPYLAQVDAGALEWVRGIKREIGNRFVMFDYHPYSFPFAVDNRARAAGLGERSASRMDRVGEWIARKAAEEEVWWVSAYANPGLEDRVMLRTVSVHTERFARIASRGALPAKARQVTVRMELCEALPLDDTTGDLAVDKVLDGGPLALREPWGHYRRTRRLEDGSTVPVEWSRQGSGIVGPIPKPGECVTVTLWAASGQDTHQAIRVVPPWDGEAGQLSVRSELGEHTVRITRPAGDPATAPTGVYRLFSPTPYDPAARGIPGYKADLGALIHRIRISTGDQQFAL